MKLNAPMIPPRPYTVSLYRRFLKYVRQSSKDGCWWWVGSKDKDGYGKFKIHGHDLKAHRVALAIFRGLGEGLTVNHKCLNRACVNPDHLEAISWADNTADANRRRKKDVRDNEVITCEPGSVAVDIPDVPYIEAGSYNDEYLPPYFYDDTSCPF